jgi:transcriptional regulator with XRE-family HTH domain
MELGERIVRWRERHGFTQAALAERIGISPAAVAQWELGDTVPTTQNMKKIADAFDISLHEFWGRPPAAKRKKAS